MNTEPNKVILRMLYVEFGTIDGTQDRPNQAGPLGDARGKGLGPT
jgi:hypothetical protein